MGSTLLLGSARTPSCPFSRSSFDHQFGDGLPDHGILNFSSFNGALKDQIHPSSTLWIPFIGFHNGSGFVPFFVVYATLEVAIPMNRPQRIGASAFVHQRGHGHFPTVADSIHQALWCNHCVGKKHLIERRMAVHLFQRMNTHPRLMHVDDEVRKSVVFGRFPIRARKKKSVIGVMRARGPDFLTVDDPLGTIKVRSCDGPCEVGTASRLTKQLAPSVFAGEDSPKVLRFLSIVTVLENRRGRQETDARTGHRYGIYSGKFLFHDRI